MRAGADFFVTAFLHCVEAWDVPYIIVARLTPLVRKVVIHRLSNRHPTRQEPPPTHIATADKKLKQLAVRAICAI